MTARDRIEGGLVTHRNEQCPIPVRHRGPATTAACLLAAIAGLAWLFGPSAPAAAADDPAARAVMERVDVRDDGDNETADMEMILIDKSGAERHRAIKYFSKDKGEDTLRMMFFLEPADVRDTGFLTWDYDAPDRDDDQWLYLPALKKTKRIAASDKSGAFMGSDLNYADMTSRTLSDYDFNFYKKRREMQIDGHRVWIVEAVPRSRRVIEETGYRKSLIFVRDDIDVVIRGISWEASGGYIKYMEVKQLDRIEGIWVATETHVKRTLGRQTIHRTVLRWHNVRFNQPLGYDFFTTRQLEKGP